MNETPTKKFDPYGEHNFIEKTGDLSHDQFIAPTPEPTVQQVGEQAQADSDAGAIDRAKHAVDMRVQESEALFTGAKLAKKTAGELVRDTAIGTAGVIIAANVVGKGLDGFLDNRDAQIKQQQEQEQQFNQNKEQQEFGDSMYNGGSVKVPSETSNK